MKYTVNEVKFIMIGRSGVLGAERSSILMIQTRNMILGLFDFVNPPVVKKYSK